MKTSFLSFAIAVFFSCCNQSSNAQSVDKKAEQSKATQTALRPNTIYYYKSAFPGFKERLAWVSSTEPKKLREDAVQARNSQSKTKDIWVRIFSRDLIGAAIEASGVTRDSEGERKLPWWADPVGSVTEAPIKNKFERTIRSLPKLTEDGVWALTPIEDVSQFTIDPAKDIFIAAADYNAKSAAKTTQAQPQSRVIAQSTAVVFRSSDKSLIFISGVKWSHPLYSEGYTEFHLHISQVTGAVISDSYAYTTFPLEPGEWTQYSEIGKVAMESIKLAAKLIIPK